MEKECYWAVLDLLVHLPVSKFIPSRMVAPTSTISHRAFGKRGKWCGGPVYQLLLVPRYPPLHRLFQQFSLVQTLWFIKPHVLTFPPDPDMGWKMFLKVISSQTRVCHAPGTQWEILPSPEEPLG